MVPDPKNEKGKIEMEIAQQELFDAHTAYYKNDWRKTGLSRSGGIQVGNSKWYLISDYPNYHLIIRKHDDNYDLSGFRFDFETSKGRGTQWSVHWNFKIGDINTVAKRKKFSDKSWVRLLNNYTRRYEEESPATEVA